MKTLVFIFIAAAMFVSCDNKNVLYDKPYFDFDSLVQEQTQLLLNSKIKIEKKTTLNDKRDSTTFTPDIDQWKYELNAFAQLDVINKPSFKNAYQINEADDEHSNLRVKKLIATIKSPVPEIRFYYLNSKKLKRIEATFEEENLMMATSRKLILEFEGDENKEALTRYFVDGRQKMIFSKPVLYSIEGKVKF